MTKDLSAHKWSVEPCPNHKKGWIRDANGKRLTILTSRGMCQRVVDAHNKAIEYLERT